MDAEQRDPIEVPHAALSAAALRALIEEFVSRDGTDYGIAERTLDEKVRDVQRQLERGEAAIMFDPESRTTHIVVKKKRHHG